MAWILLLIPALALECEKSCLDECLLNTTTTCIESCCPDFSVDLAASCSLICEQTGGSYLCSEKCVSEQSSCQENCQEFCVNREDNCELACVYEFCGSNLNSTNWVYVIGLIILFGGFVAVVYTQIDNISNKVSESEFH